MNKKDYIDLAKAIADTLMLIYKDVDCDRDHTSLVSRFIYALCDILAADNPKFDKVKFMKACK